MNKVPSGAATSRTAYVDYIRSQAESQELRNLAGIKVCFPNGTNGGKPATVSVTSNYNPLPIINIATIRITSKATMRTEQAQTSSAGWDTGC